MSLQRSANPGWVRPHHTRPREIQDPLAIAKRDLADAENRISADWRFGSVSNVARKLWTILMYAPGYRPEKSLLHYRTLPALPGSLGSERESDAEDLDACRIERNTVEYDYAGMASRRDAEALTGLARGLCEAVMTWSQEQPRELRISPDQK